MGGIIPKSTMFKAAIARRGDKIGAGMILPL